MYLLVYISKSRWRSIFEHKSCDVIRLRVPFCNLRPISSPAVHLTHLPVALGSKTPEGFHAENNIYYINGNELRMTSRANLQTERSFSLPSTRYFPSSRQIRIPIPTILYNITRNFRYIIFIYTIIKKQYRYTRIVLCALPLFDERIFFRRRLYILYIYLYVFMFGCVFWRSDSFIRI